MLEKALHYSSAPGLRLGCQGKYVDAIQVVLALGFHLWVFDPLGFRFWLSSLNLRLRARGLGLRLK